MTPVFEQVQKTSGEGEEKLYYYTYTVGEGEAAVTTEITLNKAGETKYTVGEGDDAITYDLKPVMIDSDVQKTKVDSSDAVSWFDGCTTNAQKQARFIEIVCDI